MKKRISVLFFLAFAAVAFAQTPREIVSRMEAEMEKHEKEGIGMTVDVKVPIMGSMTSQTYSLGNKSRVDATILGVDIITWTDGKTVWRYNSKKNEVEISQPEMGSESEGDAEMFSGITDGYDVSIDDETSTSWTLLCKKSRSNKDKDAPKRMVLVVAKGTYMPVSLKTTMSGITLTMRNLTFGVTEKQVTFNAKDYLGVTVVDKR